jgi:hypothetical protein
VNAHNRILDGIEAAVNRHWRFTKDLLHVKPEYLFTVSIADALANGFDEIGGIELSIKLEEPTTSVTSDVVMNSSGIRGLFAKVKDFLYVDRTGKVDIYVVHDAMRNRESWVVEVKGFDPSWNKVREDVLRLSQFLLRSGNSHRCKQCFLGFPTQIDQKRRIEQEIRAVVGVDRCQTKVHSKYVETGEDAEDGMPAYYANCIVIG